MFLINAASESLQISKLDIEHAKNKCHHFSKDINKQILYHQKSHPKNIFVF